MKKIYAILFVLIGLLFVASCTCEHEYGEWAETKAATCAVEGERQKVCSKCGDVQKESIAKLTTHSYGDWTEVEPATCAKAGSEERECSVCHNKETQPIAKLTTHSYGNWTVITEATFKAAGSQERECSVCKAKETEAIPQLTESKSAVYDLAAADDAKLAEDFYNEKYDQNAWALSAGAKVTKVKLGEDDAFKFKFWNNYCSFGYKFSIDAPKANQISFDYQADGKSKLTIQLFADSGVYAKFQLGKLANNLTHYTISLADSGWQVDTGKGVFSFQQLADNGYGKVEEALQQFSKMQIVMYGEDPNYADTTSIMANLNYEFVESPATTKVCPLPSMADAYVGKLGDDYVKVEFISKSEAKVGLMSAWANAVEMNVTYNANVATFKDKATEGATLEMVASFFNDGKVLKNGSTIVGPIDIEDIQFAAPSNFQLSLEGIENGVAISDANWAQIKYDGGWKDIQAIKGYVQGEQKALEFPGGWWTDYKYTLSCAQIGLTNKVSITLLNPSQDQQVAIYLLDAAGNKYSVFGANGAMATLSASATPQVIEKIFDTPVSAVSLVIATKTGISSGCAFYVGDLKVEFDPAAKNEVQYTELHKVDFENLTQGSDYTDTTLWTRKKWSNNDWAVATETTMRVREKNGSTVMNMICGWSTDRWYKYAVELDGVKKVSIDLGNYFSNAKDMTLTIWVECTNGDKLYLMVGETFGTTTALNTVSKVFDSAVSIKSFNIKVKSTIQDTTYLYMDNILFLAEDK